MKQIYIVVLLLLGLHFGFAAKKNTLLLPSATIAGNATVCQNATGVLITFTGSGGNATKYHYSATCRGLNNYKHKRITTSEIYAKDMGLTLYKWNN